MPGNRRIVQLPRSAKAPSVARRALADLVRDLPHETQWDVELLVSELAANAVRHGKGTIELRTEMLGGRLRVEMVDQGGGFDPRPSPSPEYTGGHGLKIVEALADRWGVHEGTTHVWFEIAA